MSQINVTTIRNRTGGPPSLDKGVVVTGVATATSFSGNLTGAITSSGVISITDATASTNTTSGALVVSGGVGIAKSLNVGGNLSVGGTLTYEDVTNIDSVGIVTAGGGLYVGNASVSGIGITASNAGHIIAAGIVTTGTCLKVGSVSGGSFGAGVGVTITGDGNAVFSGITTVTNFDAKGTLVEAFKTSTTSLNSAGNLDISTGNIQYNSTNLGGTGSTLNIISTTGINTDLATGQTLAVTGITAVNATTAFVNKVTVDGVATGITTHWVGGSVPAAGGGAGVDLYTFNLLKTGSATYIIVANQTKTS